MSMTITKTDEETIFSFTDDEAECPANKEGYDHDWHASRPTIKDGPTEDGDWEVIFPMKCVACGRTGTSEAAASDGFIEYDKEMKVGDLITGVHGNEWFGIFGTIIEFDEDNDPIVAWSGVSGSNEVSPGCGEYREGLVVVNESR